jgi:hypothetical protein
MRRFALRHALYESPPPRIKPKEKPATLAGNRFSQENGKARKRY